jgi:hypothetical protein
VCVSRPCIYHCRDGQNYNLSTRRRGVRSKETGDDRYRGRFYSDFTFLNVVRMDGQGGIVRKRGQKKAIPNHILGGLLRPDATSLSVDCHVVSVPSHPSLNALLIMPLQQPAIRISRVGRCSSNCESGGWIQSLPMVLHVAVRGRVEDVNIEGSVLWERG